MFQSSKWSREEGEEVFNLEEREKRFSIEKGMSEDANKRVSIVVGDGFFLMEKGKFFGFFVSAIFSKNSVISEGKKW